MEFDGCFNFRDLGGYRTRDGRQVRARRLFRADGPHALTDRDLMELRSLDLAAVIDLRTDGERERGSYPDASNRAMTYVLPMADVLPDVDELPTWTDPKIVTARYYEMLDAGHEAICETLAILTDPDAFPAMMHCTAGKDRTGILSAIVLGILGVPDESIIDDYALSGPAMARFIEHLHRTYPDVQEQLLRIAPAMVAAEPATMRGFVDGVTERYGSFAGYAVDLGMASVVPHLRDNLLDS
jgi:protein-tyrosine phosphatase